MAGEDMSGLQRREVKSALSVGFSHQTATRDAEQTLRFLSEAGVLLSASRNLNATLRQIAVLCLGILGDACYIDLTDESGNVARVAWAHRNPIKQAEHDVLWPKIRPTPYGKHPAALMVATGQPVFSPVVDDDWMQRMASNEAHLAYMRREHIRSCMVVPLQVDGTPFGAITLSRTEPDSQHYTTGDLDLAVELGRRMGFAVAYARQQAALQRLNADLDAEVLRRTSTRDRFWTVTSELMSIAGSDGYLKAVNPAWRNVLGHDEAILLSTPFREFGDPQNRQAGDEVLKKLAQGESVIKYEGRMRHANGSYRLIAWTVVPDGDLYYAVGRDITEERERAEQFRLLVQGVTDYAIYLLSPEGIVTNWNSGAERIKGYAPHEIIGHHFSRFYTPEDREKGEPQAALDTARREGRCEREGWRVRKDGSRFLSHVVIDAIRDHHGALLGFAKITRDITDRKKADAALDQAREELFQAQKMDAVGQLTGGIAHDFNNLLMAILGSLELLRKRLPDDAQMKRLLANAISGAQRGASLTQRMLAFARRQQLDAKPLDLPALVRSMTDFLERSIGPAVTVELRFPIGLRNVVADENQLELALLNLCVNARDALPNGGTILISAIEQLIDVGHETGLPIGLYICLSVSDNGEGMSEETLARATEPFFTTKGVGKGTGLGLPMVHGMSAQMGGRLLLKSAKGQGTTAEIWLPAADAAPAQAPTVVPLPTAAAQHALTVLAVDDDPLVLFNTTAMLEELGHAVIEAHSAADALKVLRECSVELVVTDQAMPKMTGVQLIEAIRAEWPDLPVILATGYAELPGGVKIKELMLQKPFSERELADAIAQATARP